MFRSPTHKSSLAEGKVGPTSNYDFNNDEVTFSLSFHYTEEVAKENTLIT